LALQRHPTRYDSTTITRQKKQETHIDNEENKTKDEQFSILGHQMCIKRPRDDDSQSSLSWITNSSGRVVIDPSLVSVYFFILKIFLKKIKFFYFFILN
jgi:glycine hydroxymethyltransferase